MATPRTLVASSSTPEYQRTNKTSAIKSFLHKRTQSKGAALASRPVFDLADSPTETQTSFCLPSDHPHSNPLGEIQQNQQSKVPASPKKSRDGEHRPADRELFKKTMSTASLKSLRKERERPISPEKDKKPSSPKKSKSSTHLSNLLSRPKSSKNLKKAAEDDVRLAKGKENNEPAPEASAVVVSRPPIYAQFSSESFAIQPLGGKFLEEEINLYTPRPYYPGKQQNFNDTPRVQPSLSKNDPKRPKSTYLPSTYCLQDIKSSSDQSRRNSVESRPRFNKTASNSSIESQGQLTSSHQIQEEKAVHNVAVFSSTSSKSSSQHSEEILNLEEIDAALEALLERRNIPEDQKHAMRSVDHKIKLAFIRQDQGSSKGRITEKQNGSASPEKIKAEAITTKTTEPKKRPLSMNFTLSRSKKQPGSPTKNSRGESSTSGHSPTKSTESMVAQGKPTLSGGASTTSNLIARARGLHSVQTTPEDFVNYLQKVQGPDVVEVGRIQKLRQLLRNEKIEWTDHFINLGGMKEIIGLLHRTMEVEWREEHEDALLHEVLLCLKGLCTTTLAQTYLHTVQSTLFPALIHMVFDEEKKGPSEFATRNIITFLLFTYLKFAPLAERTSRARTLLSYMRDPLPSESERPVPFVLEMHRERPYRIWGKEVVNVTKEVFWIFLHNLNVVALHSPSELADPFTTAPQDANYIYMSKHFPTEPPPVPTAPYVGSVEWDAINYLASHLDILNAILSSLPTVAERNNLREQCRISGWERCMGGTLRLCKEKFYGTLHQSLRCWVAAAADDGWETSDVRCGPRTDPKVVVRRGNGGSPKKKASEEAPKIEMPKLDLGLEKRSILVDEGWL